MLLGFRHLGKPSCREGNPKQEKDNAHNQGCPLDGIHIILAIIRDILEIFLFERQSGSLIYWMSIVCWDVTQITNPWSSIKNGRLIENLTTGVTVEVASGQLGTERPYSQTHI